MGEGEGTVVMNNARLFKYRLLCKDGLFHALFTLKKPTVQGLFKYTFSPLCELRVRDFILVSFSLFKCECKDEPPFFLRDGISRGEDFYDKAKQKTAFVCNGRDVK